MSNSSQTTHGCSIEGCVRPYFAKGFCEAHYKRMSRNQPLNSPLPDYNPQTCSVRHCHQVSYALGYCTKHYVKFRERLFCEESGCQEPRFSNGLCRTHYRRAYRRKLWEEIITAAGGRCSRCGNTYPYVVYDLHHIDPTNKKFSIGTKMTHYRRMEVLKEAEKCELVCANCHRIIHFGD